MHRFARSLVVLVLLGVMSMWSPLHADGWTPTTGGLLMLGEFSAEGLTTSPPGATSLDPAAWPARAWQITSRPTTPATGPCVAFRQGTTWNQTIFGLRLPNANLCDFSASGGMQGWCDLSKGQGSGSYYAPGLATPDWGTITSFRWTGAGDSLAVTGVMESENFDIGGPYRVSGTFVGTITLLHGTGSPPLDLCIDPDGVQSPIPVLITLNYVLQ